MSIMVCEMSLAEISNSAPSITPSTVGVGVAVLIASIGYLEHRVNVEKRRLDLLERGYAIYQMVQDFFERAFDRHRVTGYAFDILESARTKAELVFDEDVRLRMDELWTNAFYAYHLNDALERPTLTTPSQHEGRPQNNPTGMTPDQLWGWIMDQRTPMKQLFAQYLRFDHVRDRRPTKIIRRRRILILSGILAVVFAIYSLGAPPNHWFLVFLAIVFGAGNFAVAYRRYRLKTGDFEFALLSRREAAFERLKSYFIVVAGCPQSDLPKRDEKWKKAFALLRETKLKAEFLFGDDVQNALDALLKKAEIFHENGYVPDLPFEEYAQKSLEERRKYYVEWSDKQRDKLSLLIGRYLNVNLTF